MRALAAAVLLCLAGGADAQAQAPARGPGGVQVTPVVIEIAAERGLSSFRLRNARETEISFEVAVYAWTQHDGETVLTPSGEIVAAPSVFLMPPGGEQIVRLGVAPRFRGGATERSYRVLVRQLPDATPMNGPRLQLEMSMPVFVRPAAARGELQARRVTGPDGAPAILLANTGTARLHLSDAPDAEALPRLPRYLLAGAEIVRPVPQTPLRVLVADGRAAPQRLFEFADAPVLAARSR